MYIAVRYLVLNVGDREKHGQKDERWKIGEEKLWWSTEKTSEGRERERDTRRSGGRTGVEWGFGRANEAELAARREVGRQVGGM